MKTIIDLSAILAVLCLAALLTGMAWSAARWVGLLIEFIVLGAIVGSAWLAHRYL